MVSSHGPRSQGRPAGGRSACSAPRPRYNVHTMYSLDGSSPVLDAVGRYVLVQCIQLGRMDVAARKPGQLAAARRAGIRGGLVTGGFTHASAADLPIGRSSRTGHTRPGCCGWAGWIGLVSPGEWGNLDRYCSLSSSALSNLNGATVDNHWQMVDNH
jgi:hypothetical protein